MAEHEKLVGEVSLSELKEILSQQMRLEITQLELRLNDKFALRSELTALTTAFNVLKEQAILRGGPVDRAVEENRIKTQQLHDENIRRNSILDEVPVLKNDVSKLKLWRAGLAGAASLATFLAVLAAGMAGHVI